METSCSRCGMKRHWSHTCHVLKHFVEIYQELVKRNEKKVKTNFVTKCGPFDTQFNDIAHLYVVDFFIQPKDNIT